MAENKNNRTLQLSLAALGVVYGDIGTSPLYALRECFHGTFSLSPRPGNVLGVLSLIVWALIIVISIKYLLFVMRADNRGEDGIIALVALLNPWRTRPGSQRYILMLMGMFGAALLYGDGTITPAISVLSAIEGIQIATPAFTAYVVPITVGILIGLFMLQKRGTGGIGALFGPVMLVWFLVLGLLGVTGIIRDPGVFVAINPVYALHFFRANGLAGFLILGTVFLVVTGGETLYADMGHFGRKPIRVAWFALVLPALLLNYFGQGALILTAPAETTQPFYHLAPAWGLYPLVVLAAAATVIASQAVISGTFSLTRQAVQLGALPRTHIIQTSPEEAGQIYIPAVNWMLMLATTALVVGFKSSSHLASAYGVAVSADMVITSVLAFFVARRFGWNPLFTAILMLGFLVVDVAFFSANLFKVADGGWYPILVAVCVFTVMSTWRRGRQLLREHLTPESDTLEDFAKRLETDPPVRIPGTAVFMTGSREVPPILLHHLEHNRVLQDNVILLTIHTEDVPRVPTAERLELVQVAPGLFRLVLRYGFMQTPNVPVALKLSQKLGADIDLDEVTYYLGRETLIPSKDVPGMMLWRDNLFAFLSRNAMRATLFYHIPPEQVVELGLQVQI